MNFPDGRPVWQDIAVPDEESLAFRKFPAHGLKKLQADRIRLLKVGSPRHGEAPEAGHAGPRAVRDDQGVEHESGIGHAAAEETRLVHGFGERHDAGRGESAPAGFHADDAAVGGWARHGPLCLRAEGQREVAGSHTGCRSAAGSARRMSGIQRITGGGRSRSGKLRALGDAHDHAAELFQRRDNIGLRAAEAARGEQGSRVDGVAGRAVEILDADWHAEERRTHAGIRPVVFQVVKHVKHAARTESAIREDVELVLPLRYAVEEGAVDFLQARA